jgi:hypothetical protein
VVGDDGAAALGNDGRVRDRCLVADRLDVVDDVVRVLLQRVVHARLEVRLRAVVIHAQPTADVEVLQPRPELRQLGVDAGRFVERAFDDADVGDLAAEMEVQELEAILHVPGAQLLQPAHDLGDGQAELRAEAA